MKFDRELLNKQRKELRKRQANDPIRIYIEKWQKKNCGIPLFIKKGDKTINHGKAGQLITYTSVLGETFMGVGDNFTEARRDLCTVLLKKNIDI